MSIKISANILSILFASCLIIANYVYAQDDPSQTTASENDMNSESVERYFYFNPEKYMYELIKNKTRLSCHGITFEGPLFGRPFSCEEIIRINAPAL